MNLNAQVRNLLSGVILVFAALGLLGLLAACGEDEADVAADPTPTTAAAVPGAVAPEAEAEATATPTPASDITGGHAATPTPTPQGEMPAYGGVINFISCCSGSLPRGIDPYSLAASGGDPNNYSYMIQVYLPFDPSEGVVYESDLAVEWTQRDDGAWVFKLREGVTWHDGEMFNADDVVATVNRFLDEGNDVSSTVNQMRAVFSSVEKVDDYTVILHTFGSPNAVSFAYLPGYFMAMVPEHLVTGPDPTSEDASERWLFMDRENTGLAIGTGPFMMTYLDSEVEMVLERNPNYFLFDEHGQRLPYLDAFQRANVPDGTRRMARFAAGTQDYSIGRGAGLHPDRAMELCSATRDKECYWQEFPHGYFNTITNHISTEQFQDDRINAASRYAQNMDEIADLAYGGRQGYMVMDRGRFPDSAITAEEQAELMPWSVAERRDEFVQLAKDLLTEAGYPKGFEMPLPYFSGNLCSGSFLDQYTRQVDALVEIGIRGFLECREGVVGTDEIRAGRFSINAPGGSTRQIDPADGLIKFHLKDSGIMSGQTWKYPGLDEMDAMYRAANRATDYTLRMEGFRNIERYIADPKWTVYPNMHTTVTVAIHGCVRNYHPGGTWSSHGWAHKRTWLEPNSKCRNADSPYLESKGYD
jgi:ABC-type transport system substrate-binding protein